MRVFGFYKRYCDKDGFYSCEECGAEPRQPCDNDCPVRLAIEDHDNPPDTGDEYVPVMEGGPHVNT